MKKIIAFGFGLMLIGLSSSVASSGNQANSEPVSQKKEYKYKCIRSGQIHTYPGPAITNALSTRTITSYQPTEWN